MPLQSTSTIIGSHMRACQEDLKSPTVSPFRVAPHHVSDNLMMFTFINCINDRTFKGKNLLRSRATGVSVA